jgi:type I restriction enzyme S subunit
VFNGNSISVADKDKHFRGANGTPYIGTAEVGFDAEITFASGVTIPDDKLQPFRRARAGTALVCAEGGSAGRKVGFLDRDVCFGNKLFALEPAEGWDGKFLFYFAQSAAFRKQFRSLTTGLIGGVSIKKFKEIEVPSFPVEEQRRIVAVLDEVFAALATATFNAEKNLANARELFKSLLESRFDDARSRAQTCPLEQLCVANRVITYGVIKLGEHVPDGVPCLRTSNVRWLGFELDEVKRIQTTLSEEYGRTILSGGEVLVNVRGTLGGVAVVDSSMIGWNVSREVAVVPCDESKVDPQYLAFWIGTRCSQDWLAYVEKGVAYTGINISDLRSLPVVHLPLEEQRRIVAELASSLSMTRAVEASFERKLENLAKLKQSFLRRAFSGELTTRELLAA